MIFLRRQLPLLITMVTGLVFAVSIMSRIRRQNSSSPPSPNGCRLSAASPWS